MRVAIMKLPSYLQRNRYGIYYFRKVIPRELRCIAKRREIVCSLKTYHRTKAVQVSRILVLEIDDFIHILRKTYNHGRLSMPDNAKNKHQYPHVEIAINNVLAIRDKAIHKSEQKRSLYIDEQLVFHLTNCHRTA